MRWILDRKKPICPQICRQICTCIVAGEFAPGQRLMSVREVALAAGVNPNTVQRAFEQLEQQGVLYSERGAGWFVSSDTAAAHQMHRQLLQEKVEAFFRDMAELGLSTAQIKEYVKEWEA